MGYQIIPERDHGEYAVFSSETDIFVMRGAYRNEVTAYFERLEIERLRRNLDRVFDDIAAGRKPYHQFTRTIEEAEAKNAEHVASAEEEPE